MAPHSSTLAWKIPWMEEPGGLQSVGSLGVLVMMSIFSCACWSSVCLLWRNVYLDLLPIIFYIELHYLFVCFGN